MTDVEREPCPHCGEPSPLEGRICRHCLGSLLVDLFSEPWPDDRARYRAARELSTLGPPFPAFLETRRALSSPGSVIVTGVTRRESRGALAVLAASGGKARIAPSRVSVEASAGALPLAGMLAEAERESRFTLAAPWMGGAIMGAGAVALFLLVIWARSTGGSAPAPSGRETRTPSKEGRTPTTREIARQTLVSAASLECLGSGGAGFFVTPELLLTNDHVLCPEEESLSVRLRDGRKLPGRVVRRDDWRDMALVRVLGAAAPPLALGDATEVEAGDRVLAIGSPRGLEFTLTEGIVSHSERNFLGIAYLQFDGNINPGNSGGPLLDGRGRAIGIVSMMAVDARGLALALPINYAYEGEDPLLPLRGAGPAGERWQSVLTRVKRADREEVRAAAASSSLPGIASAGVTQEGDVVAVLLSRGWRASGLTFRFSLRRDGAEVCAPNGVVETWESRSGTRQAPLDDSRYVRWLERNGIASELWIGIASLRWENCPPAPSSLGAELVLLEADPYANRAVLKPIEYQLVP